MVDSSGVVVVEAVSCLDACWVAAALEVEGFDSAVCCAQGMGYGFREAICIVDALVDASYSYDI